eukprot:COSAG04_NODE_202_length_20432_cov_7.004525_10_plen_591_part_00
MAAPAGGGLSPAERDAAADTLLESEQGGQRDRKRRRGQAPATRRGAPRGRGGAAAAAAAPAQPALRTVQSSKGTVVIDPSNEELVAQMDAFHYRGYEAPPRTQSHAAIVQQAPAQLKLEVMACHAGKVLTRLVVGDDPQVVTFHNYPNGSLICIVDAARDGRVLPPASRQRHTIWSKTMAPMVQLLTDSDLREGRLNLVNLIIADACIMRWARGSGGGPRSTLSAALAAVGLSIAEWDATVAELLDELADMVTLNTGTPNFPFLCFGSPAGELIDRHTFRNDVVQNALRLLHTSFLNMFVKTDTISIAQVEHQCDCLSIARRFIAQAQGSQRNLDVTYYVDLKNAAHSVSPPPASSELLDEFNREQEQNMASNMLNYIKVNSEEGGKFTEFPKLVEKAKGFLRELASLRQTASPSAYAARVHELFNRSCASYAGYMSQKSAKVNKLTAADGKRGGEASQKSAKVHKFTPAETLKGAADGGKKRQQKVVAEMLPVTLPETVTVAARRALVDRIHGVGKAEPLFADAPYQHIQITQAFATGGRKGQRAKFICKWKPAPKMDTRYPKRRFSGFFYLGSPSAPKLEPLAESSMK